MCSLGTGVQTCALPISTVGALIGGLYGAAVALAVVNAVITLLYSVLVFRVGGISAGDGLRAAGVPLLLAAAMAVLVRLLPPHLPGAVGSPFLSCLQIGRASCRGRVCQYV